MVRHRQCFQEVKMFYVGIEGHRMIKLDSKVGDDKGQVDGLLGCPNKHSISLVTVQLEEVLSHSSMP